MFLCSQSNINWKMTAKFHSYLLLHSLQILRPEPAHLLLSQPHHLRVIHRAWAEILTTSIPVLQTPTISTPPQPNCHTTGFECVLKQHSTKGKSDLQSNLRQKWEKESQVWLQSTVSSKKTSTYKGVSFIKRGWVMRRAGEWGRHNAEGWRLWRRRRSHGHHKWQQKYETIILLLQTQHASKMKRFYFHSFCIDPHLERPFVERLRYSRARWRNFGMVL